MYALLLFASVPAVITAVALLETTDGSNLDWTTEDLSDTPFDDFLVPAMLLLVAIGGSALLGAFALLMPWRTANMLTFFAGALLTGWIIVQMTMIDFTWLQPLYLVVGMAIMVVSLLMGGLNTKTRDE